MRCRLACPRADAALGHRSDARYLVWPATQEMGRARRYLADSRCHANHQSRATASTFRFKRCRPQGEAQPQSTDYLASTAAWRRPSAGRVVERTECSTWNIGDAGEAGTG